MKNHLSMVSEVEPRLLFILCIVLGILAACDSFTRPITIEERGKLAEEAEGDIVVGIVYSSSTPNLFREGAELAVEELNEHASVIGKKIQILVYDDKGDPEEGQRVAKKLAQNPNVIAVVGHGLSKVAIPVSIIYEATGIFFLSPATDPRLTLFGKEFTYQTVPNSIEIGRKIADYAINQMEVTRANRSEAKRVVIFYLREDAYKQIADSFAIRVGEQNFKLSAASLQELKQTGIPDNVLENLAVLKDKEFIQANELLNAVENTIGTELTLQYQEHILRRAQENKSQQPKIEILATRSYLPTQTDFRKILAEVNSLALVKNKPIDAVFVAGRVPPAGALIKQVRGMLGSDEIPGEELSIFGTDEIGTQQLWTDAGRLATGTTVVTLFNPKLPSPETRDFVKNFQRKYGIEPDAWAAQGYDALRLLAYTMEQSGSSVPSVLTNTLCFVKDWQGVTGSYTFTVNGIVENKTLFFKTAANSSFNFDQNIALTKPDPRYVIEDSTLRLPLIREPDTIDPGLASSPVSVEIIEQLFVGLTSLDPVTYEARPSLAERWELTNADNTVYRFHLRQDAKWMDKTEVTAADVVWTLQRNINPATRSPYAQLLYVLKNAEAIHKGKVTDISTLGVRAIDKFTVEFTLEHPAAYFPTQLTHPVFRPLPRHTIETYNTHWTDLENINTNGAYGLVKWDKGVMLILHSNPNYYDAEKVKAMIPEVRYYFIPNKAVAMAMYERNELDMLGGASYTSISAEDISRIQVDPVLRQEFRNVPSFSTRAYCFNMKRPPMDNPLVRKAIAAAIDRHLLVKLSTRGGEKEAITFTPPLILGDMTLANDLLGISFNPVQAKQWLADAGYPDGNGFPELTIMYPTITPTARSTTAHPLKAFLEHYLHISVKLQPVSPEEYPKLRAQPDASHHLFYFRWQADYPDANSMLNNAVFHPSNSPNLIGWDDRQFATLLEDAAKITDPKQLRQRNDLYKKAEQMLCRDETVVIPLFYDVAPMLVKPRVKDFRYMPLGGQYLRDCLFQK